MSRGRWLLGAAAALFASTFFVPWSTAYGCPNPGRCRLSAYFNVWEQRFGPEAGPFLAVAIAALIAAFVLCVILAVKRPRPDLAAAMRRSRSTT